MIEIFRRCKLLVTLRKRKSKLDFSGKHLKKNKLMKTRLASTRMRVNKKQLMIRSVSHVLLNMVETMLCYRNEWNRVPSVYWWCDCWYKLQNEFWSVKDNTLYLEYAANAAKKRTSQWKWIMIQSIVQSQHKSFSRQRKGILFNSQANRLIST